MRALFHKYCQSVVAICYAEFMYNDAHVHWRCGGVMREVSLANTCHFPTTLFRFENCGLLAFVAFHFWDKSQ